MRTVTLLICLVSIASVSTRPGHAESDAAAAIDLHFAPSRSIFYGVLQGQGLMTPAASQWPVDGRFATTLAPSAANVRVNDPALDTPDRTTQNETSLAVLGATVCVGYNNTAGLPNSGSGFSRSSDGGMTWSVHGFAGSGDFGDPTLAVHRASGTFYYGDLAFVGDRSPSSSLRSIIAVTRSTDDCNSFATTTIASPNIPAATVCAAPTTSECRSCTTNAGCDSRAGAGDGVCTAADAQDKPWITVDNSGGARDGAVYACWTRFAGEFTQSTTGGEIRFSRSTDGGITFGDEQVISPATDVFPIGCHIDVGPNGDVEVAWSDRSVANQFPIRFRSSADGGLTWGAVLQVNTLPIRAPGFDRPASCGSVTECGRSVAVTLPTLNGDIRMAPQAWLAADATGGPFNGNLYVAWASDPPGTGDDSDVFFSRSTDGGHTWSLEVQLGAGTVSDQFEPFVAVGGAGTVSVAWYDRRNDPANTMIDVYTAFSRDGGASFAPIVRVTDVSFPVPPLRGQPTSQGNFDPSTSSCYMGEYIATATDGANFHYAWGDNRDRVVSGNYPTGRPDPDVFFQRLAVPPVVCVGDCDDNGEVTVNELLIMVNIALGNAPPSACPAGDANHDGAITIDEILLAVGDALVGCRL